MQNSIFYINVKKIEVDHTDPLFRENPTEINGSGFGVLINKKKYIITNYHVIEEAKLIECIKPTSDKKYIFEVLVESPEFDLALLNIKSNYDDFWDDINIMDISNPPKKGETIRVYGYPRGIKNISITKGVVSRIIPIYYSHIVSNLAIQVDSAINPGNSGGPVLNKLNNIVGMAFSHSANDQNICYMIPSFIINHFLNSYNKHGKFEGVCGLDVKIQTLENDMLMNYFNPNSISGILIIYVNIFGPSSHILKKYDILHEIDGIKINNDHSIYLKEYDEKVPYWHLLRLKYPGDLVNIKITRDRKIKEINFRIESLPKSYVPFLIKEINITNYMFYGLLFIVLNQRYLNEISSNSKTELSKYDFKKQKKINEEIIILSDIYPESYLSGYECQNVRLIKINDIEINNMSDLIKICEKIKSLKKNKIIKFEFETNEIIILNLDILSN